MSEKFDIKAHIVGACTFVKFRKGDLWYRTELGFEFPVPVADAGDASFDAAIKASMLMRYIRKHAAMLEAARAETVEAA